MLTGFPSVQNAPIRSQRARNTFKRFSNAPQLCPTFPNSLYAHAYLHNIPYQMGLYLRYNHTHHENHTYEIGLATCIKTCMRSSFRQAPSHDANCFMQEASRETVSAIHVWKMQDSIIGSFVFLEPWCSLLLGGGSSQTFPKLLNKSQ